MAEKIPKSDRKDLDTAGHPVIIECMFEIDREADTAEVLDSAARLRHARIELDKAVLLHAVAWADRNGPETIHPDQLRIRGGCRPVQLGGEGTPQIADLAPGELGAVLGLSAGSASALIADSLDLRHRLPKLWSKITRCTLPGWQARKVAQQTRNLTMAQAAEVDARLVDYAGAVGWSRLETRLQAVIADVDADNAEREADLAQHRRGVWTGRSNAHGVKTVYARMDAPAAIRLLGQVNRVADALRSHGLPGNADTRRAAALGALADPIQAAWLIAHQQQPELFETTPATATVSDPISPDPASAEPARTTLRRPSSGDKSGLGTPARLLPAQRTDRNSQDHCVNTSTAAQVAQTPQPRGESATPPAIAPGPSAADPASATSTALP